MWLLGGYLMYLGILGDPRFTFALHLSIIWIRQGSISQIPWFTHPEDAAFQVTDTSPPSKHPNKERLQISCPFSACHVRWIETLAFGPYNQDGNSESYRICNAFSSWRYVYHLPGSSARMHKGPCPLLPPLLEHVEHGTHKQWIAMEHRNIWKVKMPGARRLSIDLLLLRPLDEDVWMAKHQWRIKTWYRKTAVVTPTKRIVDDLCETSSIWLWWTVFPYHLLQRKDLPHAAMTMFCLNRFYMQVKGEVGTPIFMTQH